MTWVKLLKLQIHNNYELNKKKELTYLTKYTLFWLVLKRILMPF